MGLRKLCMGDVPITFACLMIQTTINTQFESALCMEFSRGEKENFHNFPCAVCYICFSEGCRHSDVVSSFKSILTNIFKAAAILLWKQNKCVHTLNVYSVWQYIWRMNSKWFSILGTEQQSEIVWCIHGGSHSVQYQFPMHHCPCLPPKYSIPKCPNAQYSMPSSKLLKHHRHTYPWHKVCCIRTYKWVPPF